jgi:ribosome-binding protein aMBF1 (putative translation factor)
MNEATRKALEAKGYVFGDAEDFLELNAEERAEVERRLAEERRMDEIRKAAGRAVREARLKRKLTQKQAAETLSTKQSHLSRIEAAGSEVSLDTMFKSLFKLGGTATVEFKPARAAGKGGA